MGHERYINNVKRKKERKKKFTLLGIEPMALIFNVVNNVAYLNTLQRGGSALGC
jgi:hypothetical protein